MTSILTGDIVQSRTLNPDDWMHPLMSFLHSKGPSPEQWEIYRGDEFQLEVSDPREALLVAIQIKALLKSINVNVRMSIGIGEKTFAADKISHGNGSAFIRAGETLGLLKKCKTTLAINSGDKLFDPEINLMLKLATTIMDHWLAQGANFVVKALEDPRMSQEEIGERLLINQAAVSRRRKRSQFDLIMEVEAFYRRKINSLIDGEKK